MSTPPSVKKPLLGSEKLSLLSKLEESAILEIVLFLRLSASAATESPDTK